MKGVLLSAASVSGDGENQSYGEFVIAFETPYDTAEEPILDIRLNDEAGTIWMVKLSDVEEALRYLKR